MESEKLGKKVNLEEWRSKINEDNLLKYLKENNSSSDDPAIEKITDIIYTSYEKEKNFYNHVKFRKIIELPEKDDLKTSDLNTLIKNYENWMKEKPELALFLINTEKEESYKAFFKEISSSAFYSNFVASKRVKKIKQWMQTELKHFQDKLQHDELKTDEKEPYKRIGDFFNNFFKKNKKTLDKFKNFKTFEAIINEKYSETNLTEEEVEPILQVINVMMGWFNNGKMPKKVKINKLNNFFNTAGNEELYYCKDILIALYDAYNEKLQKDKNGLKANKDTYLNIFVNFFSNEELLKEWELSIDVPENEEEEGISFKRNFSENKNENFCERISSTIIETLKDILLDKYTDVFEDLVKKETNVDYSLTNTIQKLYDQYKARHTELSEPDARNGFINFTFSENNVAQLMGNLAEIISTTLLNIKLSQLNSDSKFEVISQGQELNKLSQDSHIDTLIKEKENSWGIQVKQYQTDNYGLETFYKMDYDIFGNGIMRYISNNEGNNNLSLKELEGKNGEIIQAIRYMSLYLKKGEDDKKILNFFNDFVSTFSRFEDNFSRPEGVQNIFYIYDFMFIPSSYIYLKLLQTYKNQKEENKKLFSLKDFFYISDPDIPLYTNISGDNILATKNLFYYSEKEKKKKITKDERVVEKDDASEEQNLVEGAVYLKRYIQFKGVQVAIKNILGV